MNKQILVLGGYGSAGKMLSSDILKYTNTDLTIAGRNSTKANFLANKLQTNYPNRNINVSFADAYDKESLLKAFQGMDMVIITSPTPDQLETIAEAAIECEADMMDIFVSGGIVDRLDKFKNQLLAEKRIFITQAGCHPGIPAPLIKYGSKFFDQYETANVAMAMNAPIESSESIEEIFYELTGIEQSLLKEGKWKKPKNKDMIDFQFSDYFGKRKCYPMPMQEIMSLDKELGLKNMGVYAAGFNVFVDYFVFPLAMLLQFFKKGLGIKFCARLMKWGINTFYDNKPAIEFLLETKGVKNGALNKYSCSLFYADGYKFTSLAIISCLNQYLDGSISKPGLHLMGNSVDPQRTISELQQMGVQISERES